MPYAAPGPERDCRPSSPALSDQRNGLDQNAIPPSSGEARVLAAVADEARRRHRWQLMVAVWIWLALSLIAVTCWGQNSRRDKGKEKEPAGRFEVVETKDGVRLHVGYFPPKEPGKNVVPVMVIHEWGGQFSPYLPLAIALKEAGCAVVVPELRGHGASNTFRTPSGEEQQFDPSKMGPADVAAMLGRDLESVKGFLKKQNDEEALNLNALTLIGVGEGAVLAANWAIRDWAFPSVGSKKQGQDVKALVLVSPEDMLKGQKLDNMFRDRFIPFLPSLIVAGSEGDAGAEAMRIHKRLEAIKRRARRGDPADLQLELVPTSLNGPQLIQQVPGATEAIVKFINEQVIAKSDQFPWVKRDE